MKNRFKWLLLLTVIIGSVSFTACKSTAEGFGEDMERTGEKIQEKVD